MVKTKLKVISALCMSVIAIAGFTACGNDNTENSGNNGNSNNGNGNGNNENGGGNGNTPQDTQAVQIFVRDVNFKPLQEQVYYGEESICTSSLTEYVTASVVRSDELTLTAEISLGSDIAHITYIDGYAQDGVSICIIKTDKPVDEFYELSGKTVYAADEVTADGEYIWSGETGAEGIELRIGENVLPRDGDIRNFGVKMVHKDSVITAYKEGFDFVDMNFESYNNICFAEELESVKDVTEVIANGAKHSVKQLGGVTFRLDNRKK